MALILCIETSSDICSVVLSRDHEIVSSVTANEKNVHSSKLSLFINECFSKSGLKLTDLNAVAVSQGPGSFTGLRIGVSFAKGICYGLNIPLIAVETLKAMTLGVINPESGDLHFCPMINARNGEHYFAVYNSDLKEIENANVVTLNKDFFIHLAGKYKLLVFGDVPQEFQDDISEIQNLTVRQGIKPEAVNLISFANEKYMKGEFEDINTFEPFYLKDFKAKKTSEKLKRILKG